MSTRFGTFLAVAGVALIATVGGALLGWGVMRLEGGAAVLNQAPPRLALARPSGPAENPPGVAATAGAAEPRPDAGRRLRPHPHPQGANAPDRVVPLGRPRLAIVIDDIGQTLSAPRELLSIGVPLTFSVLPELPHSRQAADLISRAGREFIVHLPMEPIDYPGHDPGPTPLLLSLDGDQTRRRVEGYLRELPGASGASNHMGSAYTADPGRMAVVQRVLADRNLFFLNSKTSPSPVPAAIARRSNYAYLERDVFLDVDRDERLIAHALDQAVARARHRGHAIAIGHPYPETVDVLHHALAGVQARGVALVSLSDLLDR